MWIPLALLAGLADATVYASMKMLREVPPHVVLWWRYALGIPVLLAIVAVDGIPELQPGLWWVLVLNSVGIAVGSLLLIRATQIASLSSSMPMPAFTPVFLLGTSYLMLGERPGPGGTVGVVLIAVGACVGIVPGYFGSDYISDFMCAKYGVDLEITSFSLALVLRCVLYVVVIGCLFSFYPAVKASRLEIIDAMKKP